MKSFLSSEGLPVPLIGYAWPTKLYIFKILQKRQVRSPDSDININMVRYGNVLLAVTDIWGK